MADDDERRRRRRRRPRRRSTLPSLALFALCVASAAAFEASSTSSPSHNLEIDLGARKMSVADALLPDASPPPPPPPSLGDEGDRGERGEPEQCFPYSTTRSVAADSFSYPLVDGDTGEPTGASARAERGQLAELRCDSVVCPPPAVADCYMREGVCDEGREYCLIEDHVKFGPAGAGVGGATPLVAYLDCSFFAPRGDGGEGKKNDGGDGGGDKNDYSWIWNNVCGNRSDWGPWTTTRGRCVRYRREQESCTGDVWRPSSSSSTPSPLAPQYAASSTNGRPPARPLLCGPGLHCTGDAPPTPNTCVKARPRDVCYQGPWWDSSSPGACPRAEIARRWRAAQRAKQESSPPSSSPTPSPPGGLPLPDLLAGAAAYLANAPVEIYGSPLNPLYWSDPPLLRAREGAAAALEALWPRRYRESTSFPLLLPRPPGDVHSAEWNETAKRVHATSFRQIGRAWACIHTLIHNAPDPLSPKQAEASSALALWLRQHVTCCNCRGFFSQLLNEVGLPPRFSTSREEHARWWWRTHNAVSEHAASTRGGHPHLYPSMSDGEFEREYGERYGNRDALRCQNPWFLGWEDAVEMWRFGDESEERGSRSRDEL